MDGLAIKLDNNIGKIILITIVVSFTLVQIFGTYPNNKYIEDMSNLKTYFSELNHIEVKHSHKSGNGTFLKLIYSDGVEERTNKEEVISNYKLQIAKKICEHPDYVEQLKNNRYISVDLIEGDKQYAKQLFNLNIKSKNCGI
jgi:hypothetical protein